jgi:hypothetical protein
MREELRIVQALTMEEKELKSEVTPNLKCRNK